MFVCQITLFQSVLIVSCSLSEYGLSILTALRTARRSFYVVMYSGPTSPNISHQYPFCWRVQSSCVYRKLQPICVSAASSSRTCRSPMRSSQGTCESTSLFFSSRKGVSCSSLNKSRASRVAHYKKLPKKPTFLAKPLKNRLATFHIPKNKQVCVSARGDLTSPLLLSASSR